MYFNRYDILSFVLFPLKPAEKQKEGQIGTNQVEITDRKAFCRYLVKVTVTLDWLNFAAVVVADGQLNEAPSALATNQF